MLTNTIKDEFEKWFDGAYPVTSAYEQRAGYQSASVKELMLSAYQAGQAASPEYLQIGQYDIAPTDDGIYISIAGDGEGMLTPYRKFAKLIDDYYKEEF